MSAGSRILLSGGHEFNRRSGNDALCDLVVELADAARPAICLLPTASGDPEDQIASFRRAFGERDCDPSAISLFRLGTEPVDMRAHLLAQDVIYAGGGSLVNLLAIWRAHEVDTLLLECAAEGILICGQSAGAMCWFEFGITCSSGPPAVAPGLGLLPGSATVHYHSEPERRQRYLRAVGSGEIPGGLGLDDQTAALFEDGRLVETVSAREGASVWRVEPPGEEHSLPARQITDQRQPIDVLTADVLELRQTLAARTSSGRSRLGHAGRLD